MKISVKYRLKKDETLTEKALLTILLRNRKIKDIKTFLEPKDPLLLRLTDFGCGQELKKTLKLMRAIWQAKKSVVVYTDYDADGITGGAILWETLHLLGFAVMPYVPHRQNEGYGFSNRGIDQVNKLYHPALIISVDHGITAAEKVKYAKSLGISVIITDHHLKPAKLPTDAAAIFHISELSGAGVAYVLAKELYEYFKNFSKEKPSSLLHLRNHFSGDYLALASIGAIADLVPLLGPTRSIVVFGLAACIKTKRLGLLEIFRQAGILGRKITPYEVGFIIAPRINAIGRLTHAIDALRLLCTTSSAKAQALAGLIGEKNRQRQDLVKTAVAEAKIQVTKKISTRAGLPKLIILVSDKWHEGIIGLIAAKIGEEYYRPTIVMTKADGFLKASARSIPTFHLTRFLQSLRKYLVDVGGHAGAAGFTIRNDKVKSFISAAQKKAEKQIAKKELEKTTEVDIDIPLRHITFKLVRAQEKLQPYGVGNPAPVFISEAQILATKILGKNREHLKFIVKDPKAYSFPVEMMAFGKAEQFAGLSRDQIVKIIYTVGIDRWNGEEKITGRVISCIIPVIHLPSVDTGR
ncbi:single-stranded-DNA-specific exonuclease RecJ [Candidatus Roizmanbacteria bacterium]|nr:single-stranded-DNA-specific exonuclease RecJ [Candidatus Roizmanbacteria bacterium]